MDYQTLIHTICDPLIEHKDALLIKELPNTSDKDISLLIVASDDDIARLIGKKGCIANSIRDICLVAGKLENKHVHLKFESFSQENEKGE